MSLSDPRTRSDLGHVNKTPYWSQGPEPLPNLGLREVAEASSVPGPPIPLCLRQPCAHSKWLTASAPQYPGCLPFP